MVFYSAHLFQLLLCARMFWVFYCKRCGQDSVEFGLLFSNVKANLEVQRDAYSRMAHTSYYFTYLLVRWMDHVCFISWCDWLSTTLQVCKRHKMVQEPEDLFGSWELQASPSLKSSSRAHFLPPQRTMMRWKQLRPFDVVPREESPNWWESRTGGLCQARCFLMWFLSSVFCYWRTCV